MSEIMNARAGGEYRLKLLAGVSVLVLVACISGENEVQAATDSDRPTVWIEGGWHFDNITGRSDLFTPPLDALTAMNGLPSVTSIENTLGRSAGAEGSISFQPKGSDWVFSASARYGRTHSIRNVHRENEIYGPQLKKFVIGTPNGGNANIPFTPSFDAYADQTVNNSESNTVVDFQVGKDVGLGLLGRGTDSVVSFGARYAQLNTKSRMQAHAEPDAAFVQLSSNGFFGHKYQIYTNNHASAALAERYSDVRAIGPSLSLNNTTALLGDRADGQLALDWGVNAAVLFGRQRSKVHYQSTTRDMHNTFVVNSAVAPPVTSTRSRHVIIPNLGGFAGISYRFTNAKLSAGYRADFFFGAMDGGLDTHNSMTMGFNGPFATISIGLGG